ncbi:APC family permease [Bacillus sp. AFS041924]|uniref:APC family permease n=1 Tax=Bacillus sp. AFS041924 TaxID=2033503 RepID=UPI000BFDC6F5|nr:APC family permease [Bacillus sp. AFS041924]PGS55847.1 amino acid permease [Bacillus sp. AFS041924]
MRNRKIGFLLLSGLMIGPILGSGIIILPPAVYETAGNYAILAWFIMLGLSLLFALMFGKLSLMIPGDSGVPLAVERAFGTQIKNLSAIFFLLAVCFGPIAVTGTAGHYLQLLTNQSFFDEKWLSLGILCFVYIILTRSIADVGKFAFFMSSFIVVTLIVGSVHTLFTVDGSFTLSNPITVSDFGESLLLLFWALIGWEVIGSYSLEVKTPERTIPRAVILSFSIIAIVSLIVAFAFQWIHSKVGNNMDQSLAPLLQSLFGSWSTPIISSITIALCISTVLLVIGAVSRLIADQAKNGLLPSWLSFKNKNNVATRSLFSLFCIHIIVFILYFNDFLSIQTLVAIANAFFLCNALLGVLACIRLFDSIFFKIGSLILAICFLGILMFSSPIILVIITLISVCFFLLQKRVSKQHDKILQAGNE